MCAQFTLCGEQVTGWVVHLAPVGVCFLIAGEILQMRSVLAELQKLAWLVHVSSHFVIRTLH